MKSAKKPNILFILSDDQGYWSLGAYGNQEIKSPVLDRLANEGACFENFYCTSPVCSPARASILTGLMPSAHGVLDWLGGGAVDKSAYANIMLPRQQVLDNLDNGIAVEDIDPVAETLPFSLTRNYNRFMAHENKPLQFLQAPTYTEHLAQQGYRCGIAGKWHLGAGNLPQAGFDFWSVVPRGGTPYTMPDWISNDEIHIGSQYATDLITDEAIRFLDQPRDEKPFYLSVHYTAPHDPWRKIDQPADIWALYDDCEFASLPQEPLHKNQVMKRPRPKDEAHRLEMAQAYYSCITAMDQNIGRLLTHLEQTGELDNTIVVFTADNGMNFGHHGIWGKGNGTYPQNLYETAAKIPYIMWNPQYIKPGSRIETPLSHYDVFQTLLELAQVEGDDAKRPGESFCALLQGQADTARARHVVVYDEYGPVRMIRNGDWKLIYCYLDDTGELYNLKNDPNEVDNLYDQEAYATRVVEMKESLDAWFAQYTTPVFDALQFPVNGEGQMHFAPNWHQGETVFVKADGTVIQPPFKKEISYGK